MHRYVLAAVSWRPCCQESLGSLMEPEERIKVLAKVWRYKLAKAMAWRCFEFGYLAIPV